MFLFTDVSRAGMAMHFNLSTNIVAFACRYRLGMMPECYADCCMFLDHGPWTSHGSHRGENKCGVNKNVGWWSVFIFVVSYKPSRDQRPKSCNP